MYDICVCMIYICVCVYMCVCLSLSHNPKLYSPVNLTGSRMARIKTGLVMILPPKDRLSSDEEPSPAARPPGKLGAL